MKIYKIITKSGQKIPLEGREALDAVIDAANRGIRLIVTKHGVIDTSSIDSIVPHIQAMNEIDERTRQIGNAEQAKMDVLGSGAFSDFAEKTKILK